jgi:hypothetical protein
MHHTSEICNRYEKPNVGSINVVVEISRDVKKDEEDGLKNSEDDRQVIKRSAVVLCKILWRKSRASDHCDSFTCGGFEEQERELGTRRPTYDWARD